MKINLQELQDIIFTATEQQSRARLSRPLDEVNEANRRYLVKNFSTCKPKEFECNRLKIGSQQWMYEKRQG